MKKSRFSEARIVFVLKQAEEGTVYRYGGSPALAAAPRRLHSPDARSARPHGTGKMTYADGHVYEGAWKDGQRDGPGVATHANGDVCEGTFVEGRRQGRCIPGRASGRVERGIWRDDELVRAEQPVMPFRGAVTSSEPSATVGLSDRVR